MGRVVGEFFSKIQKTWIQETSYWEGYSSNGRGIREDGRRRQEHRDGIIRFNDLNNEAFEDNILSIDHTTKQGTVVFDLVEDCKMAKYLEGNCKLAWDCLVAKYLPKRSSFVVEVEEDVCNEPTGECEDAS